MMSQSDTFSRPWKFIACWYVWRATARGSINCLFLSRQVWRRGWDSKSRSQLALPLRGPAPSCLPTRGSLSPAIPLVRIPPSICDSCREATPFPVINCCDLLVLWRATARGSINCLFLSRQVWRRGWDSNPRCRCQHSCSPGTPIRPLSHLSVPCRSELKREGILARGPVRSKTRKGPANPQTGSLESCATVVNRNRCLVWPACGGGELRRYPREPMRSGPFKKRRGQGEGKPALLAAIGSVVRNRPCPRWVFR